MAHTFCCNHPQSRIDSPEPPARQPAIIIDSLLTAAALPEDHPHAFQFPDKKPAMAGGILRSPSMANKIKSQLWRRSSRAMSNGGDGCDEDAKDITEAEMEWLFGGVDGATDLETVVERATPDGFRTPAMSDLEWIEPLVGRPRSSSDRSEGPQRQSSVVRLAAADTSHAKLGDSQPTSISKLLSVFDRELEGSTHAEPSNEKARSVGPDAVDPTRTGQPEKSDLIAARSITELAPEGTFSQCHGPASTDPLPLERHDTQQSTHYDGVHLQNLRISQQLRSMSPGSDSTDCGSMASIYNATPWNFHHRKASTLGGGSIHCRKGSAGLKTMPSQLSVGRVRSPAASSTYSQASAVAPTNMSAAVGDHTGTEVIEKLDADVPSALDGNQSDWPLPRETAVGRDTTPDKEEVTKAAPLVAEPSMINPSDPSTGADISTVRWSTPPERTGSLPSKESSSHFSVSSKRGRVFERFSPAKRLVRKRRSIFKFLRPGSRKQQSRSVSSPLMSASSRSKSGAYDGPTDDPALMTMACELVDQPPASRSVSMGNLVQEHRPSAGHLAVPDSIQRRPSLADYERVLTAAGDDRRRPSVIDLAKLKEVQEDDRRQSTSLRRKLSRAKPLDEDHTGPRGLMTQAAERNLQEKAMFRSASKRREAIAVAHGDHQHPLFRTDTLTSVAASSPSANTSALNELLDPLDISARKSSIVRAHSAGYLIPPGAIGAEHVPTHISMTPDTKATCFSSSPLAQDHLPRTTEATPVRIGTAPAAWSRFPSHTRLERSGPASRDDAVITRDFAVQEEVEESSELPDLPSTSPNSKHSIGRKTALVKKRSTTFGQIKRFYSNVFTNGFSPSNRRSSVATGGWLANPDLELLPPTTSHEPTFPHHDHHFKQHLHDLERELEDRVVKDVEYVEAGAVKLGEQIREDVEAVEEEAEKLMHITLHHHHQHHHGKQAVRGPFGNDNPFAPGHEHVRQKRDSTFVSPLDEEGELMGPSEDVGVAAASTAAHAPSSSRIVSHDGAADIRLQQHKAEEWSSTYKDCLIPSGTDGDPTPASTPISTLRGMPPPQLKPAKARSPDQNKGLDPNATVRRFPSVTVVDDRKGHDRSISLLSVKVGSDGIMRSSTNDLLKLIEARERQEREHLLRGPSRASERSTRQRWTMR